MPVYANIVPPISISNPQPALPYKSAQVALVSGMRVNAQRLSAEVTFAAAPGVFSFQLQTADSDVEASYSPEGAVVSALTGTNVARIELNNVVARFARIVFATLTNNVAVTAKLTS